MEKSHWYSRDVNGSNFGQYDMILGLQNWFFLWITVFFKRLNKNLVSTEANLWNLLKSIWHSFRSSLFPLSFQSQSQYFIYILYNYYFLWKMHYHLLKNLPCQLLLSYFYLVFSYSTTDKLEKAKCQSSKAQRQSSTDILKNKDLNLYCYSNWFFLFNCQ